MATINVTCPECQANLKIPDIIAPGKKIRCPKCKATFVLPVEEEAIAPAAMGPAIPNFVMSSFPLAAKPSLQEIYKIQVDTLRKNWSVAFPTTTISPPEYLKLNGLDFARSRVSLNNWDRTLNLHGFVCFTIDGPTGCLFLSTELEKNSGSLKLHEASVQTFKK
jgi:predicted Zn finger-like uncharacterized protein